MNPLLERDKSWIQFNKRVLQEAADRKNPLIERLRFLGIFSSNLDEFSRVRLPLLQSLRQLKNKTKKKLQLKQKKKLAKEIQHDIQEQLEVFGQLLTQEILPELHKNGIHLYYNEPFEETHLEEVSLLFWSNILAFIQPVFLNADQTFLPENGQPHLLVALRNEEGASSYAFINIPTQSSPRFYKLSTIDNRNYYCFIDDIIRQHINAVFPRMKVEGVYSIKLDRDAELHLQEEFTGDVLKKLEKSLKKRDLGPPSRLLFESSTPKKLQWFLAGVFGLQQSELFAGGRYHNLKDLLKLPVNQKELVYPEFTPVQNKRWVNEDLFSEIDRKDILLHFPYESYNPILRFFNQAAINPDVEAIYISLYRVAEHSQIVNALISAALNGKSVHVFVELKARFDEENNIRWSRKMTEAGIKIIYSIPDIKVHSKIALVVKKNADKTKYYSLISTGNFNEQTARIYTDHTLFTAHPTIAGDLLDLFLSLEKRKALTQDENKFPKALLIASQNMVAAFEQLIDNQVKRVKNGEQGCIRLVMNNLEEPGMIGKLYAAAQKGVTIKLLVRGICCLVPQMPGVSENIHVRRIVGRFLEHSRFFIFGPDEDFTVHLGSADWMTRNLYHRIEVVTPVWDTDLKEQLRNCFELQWSDNSQADKLEANGLYTRISSQEQLINAQEILMQRAKKRRE